MNTDGSASGAPGICVSAGIFRNCRGFAKGCFAGDGFRIRGGAAIIRACPFSGVDASEVIPSAADGPVVLP